MTELKNFAGGTVDDPCPTAGAFALWAGSYCSYNDYRAWRIRARDLFANAIQPAYFAWAKAAHANRLKAGLDPEWVDADYPFFVELGQYTEAYDKLPIPEKWATPDSQRFYVQRAVTLAVLGDQLVTRMKADTQTLGGVAPVVSGTSEDAGWNLPDFELPDLPSFGEMPDWNWPAVNLDVPWYVWAGGALGVVVVGTGIYYAAKPTRKRRR